MARIDIYNLTPSPQVPITGRQEIGLDNLGLTVSPIANSGIITGTVTSGGSPLEGATIKVLTPTFVQVEHNNSNPQGQYVIPGISQGTYLVTATKQGYLTSTPVSVSVVVNNPTIVNINLLPDPDAAKNTLDGRIRNFVTSEFLSGATVNVYEVVGGVNTLILTTTTNSAGQYLAPYLDDGVYFIEGNKLGYLSTASSQVTLSGAEIATLDLTLTADPQSNTGTIAGRVVEQGTLNYLANATVALYSVVGTIETVVQISKTNSVGAYLFGNVQAGTYIVKAVEQTR